MGKIIDGQALAEKIKDQIVKEILELNNNKPDCQRRPNLAIILIGEREDSKLYVNLKEKEAKRVGIDVHTYKLPENTEENKIISTIECLNNDKLIDGILVQLPLPKGFDTDKIIKAIDPSKDVDCFHPENLKIILGSCNHNHLISPVFSAVLEMLSGVGYQLKNKKICIIANSDIFGKSLEKILECQKAKVKTIKSGDKNLGKETSEADILITAIGKPKFIKKEMIKKEAIVIDIGITKKAGKVCGDVDFAEVKDKAGYITPVPGGVGPLTIAMLFRNTLELYKLKK
ncbi:MAG: bifunctional 5,10-methylenetetrahydrofolate dehydrogenase/5,10-methenyltetrahydrofolate cyclohydrolase [Patescibacteria group bacterium]|nr:bifunctional 5,10-methylenetetrahydrofolate dehydrogenase/5,10-methenyltetrahydrofolate cyclohydrolase [Patescibacteria group bacterium]MDD5294428.1 bifunctional 5,10-methylenetetrahydrofolate dehydrogenase/5,10-methenyltetrahydrofolate cyclohydrolase [Patescibacteria group bacterium]MDD5554102.1 bifunctional 5,10-methylenetetrahydrofolate dehydrogenase/5,10-methenyltetrahydrofolate cyclohydrolase [Patescibacteria group bacterium]